MSARAADLPNVQSSWAIFMKCWCAVALVRRLQSRTCSILTRWPTPLPPTSLVQCHVCTFLAVIGHSCGSPLRLKLRPQDTAAALWPGSSWRLLGFRRPLASCAASADRQIIAVTSPNCACSQKEAGHGEAGKDPTCRDLALCRPVSKRRAGGARCEREKGIEQRMQILGKEHHKRWLATLYLPAEYLRLRRSPGAEERACPLAEPRARGMSWTRARGSACGRLVSLLHRPAAELSRPRGRRPRRSPGAEEPVL